jgi:hypothetical protein
VVSLVDELSVPGSGEPEPPLVARVRAWLSAFVSSGWPPFYEPRPKGAEVIRVDLMAGRTQQSYRFHLMRVVFAHAHGDHEPLYPGPVK